MSFSDFSEYQSLSVGSVRPQCSTYWAIGPHLQSSWFERKSPAYLCFCGTTVVNRKVFFVFLHSIKRTTPPTILCLLNQLYYFEHCSSQGYHIQLVLVLWAHNNRIFLYWASIRIIWTKRLYNVTPKSDRFHGNISGRLWELTFNTIEYTSSTWLFPLIQVV